MSPDWSDDPKPVPFADLTNPQTLNLYQYEGNNPLAKADKDGHCYPFCTVAVGAIVGAGAGALAEYAGEKLRGEPVDSTKIWHAAAGGAVAGAITGLAGPEAGIGSKIAASVLGQVAGGETERGLNGEKVTDPKEMAKDAVAGAAGTKIESVAEKTFASTTLKTVVPVVVETAADTARRGSPDGQEKPQTAQQPQQTQPQIQVQVHTGACASGRPSC